MSNKDFQLEESSLKYQNPSPDFWNESQPFRGVWYVLVLKVHILTVWVPRDLSLPWIYLRTKFQDVLCDRIHLFTLHCFNGIHKKKKVSYFKRVLANKIVLHFKWMGSKKQYLWYQWYNREEIKNSLMIDIKLHFFSLFNQAFFCKFISWNTVKPGLHPLKPQHDVVVVERVFYNIMTWKYTEIRLNVWLYVWIFKCVDNLLNVLFIFVNFSVSKWLLPL